MYLIAKLVDFDDQPLGYVAYKEGTKKLMDTNLYTEDESDQLRNNVNDLNTREELRAHWPDAHDPEVQELINDPEWNSLEWKEENGEQFLKNPAQPMERIQVACEMIARERAGL